jgi:hypothetical protein
MTALADELAAASDQELADMRRVLHRAGASLHRLGFTWPTLLAPMRPRLLAAVCVEIDAERARRGKGIPCSVCLAEVTRPRVTDPAGPPGPLDPTGLADTFAGQVAEGLVANVGGR